MGYTNGRNTFWPDDSDTEMYLSGESYNNLPYILNKIKEKWPKTNFEDIEISAEYIHTDCIGYDRYDPGDYTKFLLITNRGK